MATGVPSSVSQTPAQKSFAGMKRFVVSVIQGANDHELLDFAGQAINTAIDRLNMRKWKWMLTSQDITLTATDPDYSLDSGFKAPSKLQLLNSSDRVIGKISWKDPEVFRDEHSESTSDGTPRAYTVENQALTGVVLLDPPPDSAFVSLYPTARLHYFKRLSHLAGDSDTLDTVPEVWTFCVHYAREIVARDRGEPSVADRERREWKDIWSDLRADDLDTATDFEDS